MNKVLFVVGVVVVVMSIFLSSVFYNFMNTSELPEVQFNPLYDFANPRVVGNSIITKGDSSLFDLENKGIVKKANPIAAGNSIIQTGVFR